MKITPNKLWIILLALGWLFDFLFWEKSAGVNFAIFWTICLTVGFYLLLKSGLHPHIRSIWLLPLFGFFAVVTFLRAEPITAFLAYTFTLFTLSVFTVTYLGGRWMQYTFVDYVSKYFSLVLSVFARIPTFMSDARKNQPIEQASKVNIMPVLRGLLISLPIVAIFASLLASADVIFGQQLESFIKAFRLENLPDYIFRMIYILVLGYALGGIFLHAAQASTDEKISSEGKAFIPPFLGFIESSIVLGSVVALFAAFVVVQFQYFFGGTTNINVEGYTYAEYARKGFGELVAVAFFALMLLLTISGVTKRESEAQRRLFSTLGIALVLLLLVMLVSAYQRLNLYEAAYGFSRLRTYTHVFLIWIGLLLVATIALEILRKERAFAFAMLVASLGFSISLAVLNVDAFIVKQNIQRELSEKNVEELDSQYFIELSDDAIPTLVAALQDSNLPDTIHEKIGASLACIRMDREPTNNWQSFHLSKFRAEKALLSVRSEIDQYTINDLDEYPLRVTTPSGVEYSCSSYYYD